jgi:hypothetical protein
MSRAAEFPYTARQQRWWFATHGAEKSTVAFHASTHEFDAFDVAKAGTRTDDGFLGRGLYFSTDSKVARKGEHLYEVGVRLKKPLVLQSKTWSTVEKKKLVREALGLPMTASADDVTKAARAAGYDGVVLDNSPVGYMQEEIVVFSNEQVGIRKRTVVQ